MKNLKMEPQKISQNSTFTDAKRKLRNVAFKEALKEFQNDNTIDLQKRTDEIFNEKLLQLKKEKEEKDLLSGINKLVDKNSNIEERYYELISEEAREKLEIRNKADEILKELKKEQKFKQLRKAKSEAIDKKAEEAKKQEEAKKIQSMEYARRTETLRRANYSKEKKRYEDKQGKVANLVEQLAFINKTQNAPIQDNKTSSVQKAPVQKPSVRPSNIGNQNPITEKVVIKEAEPTPAPKKEEKPAQALVPKKQKPSFIERIRLLGNKSI